MNCKKCGKKLKIGENYCTVCGYYNNIEEELEDESTLDNDEDYYDEIEEIDEEDYLKNNDDIDDNNNDDYDENNDDDNEIMEENLINVINIQDDKEINEVSTVKSKNNNKNVKNFKDDRLLEAFIGEDYKWIIRRPINIYALLLSWMYFMYRKMYIIGILGLILTGIICKLAPTFIIPYIIIVMISSGLLFNPIYKAYANFKISKIKKVNYGTDDFTLEQICKEKGGTSLIISLIIFLIFIVVMFRTYYKVIFNTENTKYWTENSENRANCTSYAKSNYKILQEKSVEGKLEETVCNIRLTNTIKSYDTYIKIKNEKTNTYKYIYFKDNKDSISIEGIDVSLEELQTKNGNNTITDAEKEILLRLLEIKTEYNKIQKKSIEEDNLIKERKNKSEKLNYIITKDEILR